MIDVPEAICHGSRGYFKHFDRPVDFITPYIHKTAVKREGFHVKMNAALLGGNDYNLLHFKYPCIDIWLKKLVKGGRLSSPDSKRNVSQAEDLVRGKILEHQVKATAQSMPVVFCSAVR